MTANQLLCVDDDPETLRVRRLLLESKGYSVLTATSGEQALKSLSENPVDLLLLDYLMPGMNGDQLAAAVRTHFPSLRIIAVSGVADLPQRLLNSLDANVPKGADPELLLSTVARLCPEWRTSLKQVQKTILCVDDDDLELNARKRLFEAAGFRVLEARSQSSALQLFRSNPVDVAVLDYWLSGLGGTGTTLAQEIKRISPNTPVLMLSGYGALPGEADVVDTWMSKSRVEPQDLVNEVERLMKQRGQKKNIT